MKSNSGNKIKGYFAKPPKKWILIYLAVCVLLVFIDPSIGFICFLLLLIGLALLYSYKISDEKFDEILREDLRRLHQIALQKLRVSESELVSTPELILSPTYWNIGKADFGIKKGRDKKIRYTPVHVALLYFTEHKLCIYQCALDLTTKNPLNTSTKKYFYDEIVAVETASESITIDEDNIKSKVFRYMPTLKKHISNKKIQLNSSEYFLLLTRGGNSVKIQLPDINLIDYGVTGTLPRSKADKAIAAVEAMIDSKKSIHP
ncbi:hypothetical protein AB9P05_00395 [Roseivirga sp. BDSF3-8]|uniref:hypothetical protein n=1 Tax=Roseivirga sp. BDSF3-8 TaxID=3241598 RepID=UPI003531B330